jgi:CRISPR-associated protein Cmr2
LWFGSFLLSELSKAAAHAVAQSPNVGVQHLIFPSPESAEMLEPAKGDDDSPKLAVANVILAELPEGTDTCDIAKRAHEAVESRWQVFATQARQVVASHAGVLRKDLWSSQLRDAIEFYAAWTPIAPGQYGKARARVMRLLAGRKACRDFIQPKGDEAIRRVPKSSLDGRRETVLQENIPPEVRQKLYLNKGEQLCAVGLTKRLAEGKQPYPSVSRIAADPWLRGVVLAAKDDEKVRDAFDELRRCCSTKPIKDYLVELDQDRFPQYKDFPYEGTCLFRNRFEDWRSETGSKMTIDDQRALLNALEEFKSLGLGQPKPYLGILVADGDHIGQLLSQLKQSEEHRDFSRALAGFSEKAKDAIVKHRGVCVFAGGDDVLAFVPVDQCLYCARELHNEFAEQLKRGLPKKAKIPTLSVGIAIGHCLEPLEDLRDYGKQAEKMAKDATLDRQSDEFGKRNGLAVMVHPRSGAAFDIRERWQTNGDSLDKRLAFWAGLFSKQKLPMKLPYELRQTADDYEHWPHESEEEKETIKSALEADVMRLVKRKNDRLNDDERELVHSHLKSLDSSLALRHLAKEMLVSQWIAEAQRQANPQDDVESKGDDQ